MIFKLQNLYPIKYSSNNLVYNPSLGKASIKNPSPAIYYLAKKIVYDNFCQYFLVFFL